MSPTPLGTTQMSHLCQMDKTMIWGRHHVVRFDPWGYDDSIGPPQPPWLTPPTPPPSAKSNTNIETPKGGIDINPENNKPSKRAYSNVIKNVLTNNQEFKSFIKFIKNGFKIKK